MEEAIENISIEDGVPTLFSHHTKNPALGCLERNRVSRLTSSFVRKYPPHPGWPTRNPRRRVFLKRER